MTDTRGAQTVTDRELVIGELKGLMEGVRSDINDLKDATGELNVKVDKIMSGDCPGERRLASRLSIVEKRTLLIMAVLLGGAKVVDLLL